MTNKDHITLFQLNNLVKNILTQQIVEPQWICAEISEFHENSSGHCYLELVEKDESSINIVARAKAMIWSFAYRMIRPYFETTTGEQIAVGMKVLVKVEVTFHEAYGYSLNIKDIDPSYTMGDIARKRALVIQKLQEEGVMDMNKELPLPKLLQRIAIISSETAAGYGDFCHQLEESGYVFYTNIFPASMQGKDTETSIIAALEKVYDKKDFFDVVVIIRGGGSTSDLSWFDTYNLAYHCTQFPLPIFSGIGHERDISVLDMVACKSLKTPTATAKYIVQKMEETEAELLFMQQSLSEAVLYLLQNNKNYLENLLLTLPWSAKREIEKQHHLIENNSFKINLLQKQVLEKKYQKLLSLEKQLELLSPYNLLKKGYSITLKDGKIVRKEQITAGDNITTILYDGSVESIITKL